LAYDRKALKVTGSTTSVGRTSAVRPFIASRVVALSDQPLSTKAAGIIVRRKQRTQKTTFPFFLMQVKLTAVPLAWKSAPD